MSWKGPPLLPLVLCSAHISRAARLGPTRNVLSIPAAAPSLSHAQLCEWRGQQRALWFTEWPGLEHHQALRRRRRPQQHDPRHRHCLCRRRRSRGRQRRGHRGGDLVLGCLRIVYARWVVGRRIGHRRALLHGDVRRDQWRPAIIYCLARILRLNCSRQRVAALVGH